MEKKKNTVFDLLNRLFSSKVILQKIDDKRLNVVDLNQLQSDGSQYGNADNYNVHRGVNVNKNLLDQPTGRYNLYREYEIMDRDGIIHAALDIYADESTTRSYDGDILEIDCKDDTIKKLLENLFYDILNIEQNIWSWLRQTCKYGDSYLYLDIRDSIGIVNVVSLSPYLIERFETQGENGSIETTFRFNESTNLNVINFNSKELKEYQVAHFRLIGDYHFYPYGKSMLEGARKEWKKLVLMEDAMLIHRITRAPDRRMFYIDVGNIDAKDIDQHLENIKTASQRTPFIDRNTGEYNLRYNVENITEDFYFPVRGDKTGTKVENLPGLQYQTIDDIDYIKNKMFASLKISKAFLGFEEEAGEKSSVAAQDIRLARTIDNIQRQFVHELYKIAWIHLTAQGYKRNEILEFKLSLNTPSIIYEQEQLQLLNGRIDAADRLKSLNLVSYDYIYRNVLKLSDGQIKEEKEKLLDDLRDSHRFNAMKAYGFDPKYEKPPEGIEVDLERTLENKEDELLYVPNVTDKKDLGGRPEEGPKYKSHSSNFGYDALGGREVKSALHINKNIGNKGKNYGKKSNFEDIDSVLNNTKFLNN